MLVSRITHLQALSIVLPQLDDLQELKVMLAERLEEWALGYKAEGKVEGVQLGEALA